MFDNWVSENNIKCFDNKFDDYIELGSGNLGKVYRATRNNGSRSYALKEINNINDIVVAELINDLEIRRKFNAHINVLKFYGFVKSEHVPGYYILVMEYADSGTIRQYLGANVEKLTWEDKYHLASQLVSVISDLHDEEIIMHGYLNANTILVHQKTIKLKFFIKVNKKSNEFQPDHSIYPYTDPKMFKVNVSTQLDKKSDVYSVGVLLWEISSGRSPFNGNYTIGLAMEIKDGRREQIIPNTPDYYSKIYTECWDDEPDKRPSMCDVKAIFDEQVTEE